MYCLGSSVWHCKVQALAWSCDSDKGLTVTARSVDKFTAPLEAPKMFVYESVIVQNTERPQYGRTYRYRAEHRTALSTAGRTVIVQNTERHSVRQDVPLSLSKPELVYVF